MNYLKVLKGLNIKGAENIAVGLSETLPKYGITTDEDISRFLANTLKESGEFTVFTENLNYKSSDRLKSVFKSAFDPKFGGKYNPNDYLGNPEKLANLVYDSRIFPAKGLGNNCPGDGFAYRGRGYIQCTGKALYAQIMMDTGIDCLTNPDLLASEKYRIVGACVYWKNNKLSKADSLLKTRQVVTGNHSNNPIGYPEVLSYYNRIKSLL